jgi:hypothetical protein
MVRTLLGEWAYARPFRDTAERISLLPVFLDFYNRARLHWSLAGQPPISRTPVNNPMGEEHLVRELAPGSCYRRILGGPRRCAMAPARYAWSSLLELAS